MQGSIREEWNWPISCLNDSETQERETLGTLNRKNFPWAARLGKLGNRSVFSLDPRLFLSKTSKNKLLKNHFNTLSPLNNVPGPY